jgi:hypothetical protein
MGGRPTGVGDYWAARWRETWSVIKSEIGGHVRSVVGLVAAALFGPPVLRLFPFFSGTSRPAWDKLQADFWENALISLVVVVVLLALAALIAALRAPYRVWGAAVVGTSAGAQPQGVQHPATDLFKDVMQRLPSDSALNIEATYTDPSGGTTRLKITPGAVAGTGNETTLPAENQPAAQAAKPPQVAGS